jgi:hypothetical protein
MELMEKGMWPEAATSAYATDSDEELAERCKNGATYWCDVLNERRDREKKPRRKIKYDTRRCLDKDGEIIKADLDHCMQGLPARRKIKAKTYEDCRDGADGTKFDRCLKRLPRAERCRWHLQDGEVAETSEQNAAYKRCLKRAGIKAPGCRPDGDNAPAHAHMPICE